MTFSEFLTQVGEFLDSRLFGIGDTNVTIASVLTVLIIVIATIWGARIARRTSRRVMRGRGITDEGTVGSISSLVNYVVLFVGFAIAMRTIGIDLDALFAAGAIFAISRTHDCGAQSQLCHSYYQVFYLKHVCWPNISLREQNNACDKVLHYSLQSEPQGDGKNCARGE